MRIVTEINNYGTVKKNVVLSHFQVLNIINTMVYYIYL